MRCCIAVLFLVLLLSGCGEDPADTVGAVAPSGDTVPPVVGSGGIVFGEPGENAVQVFWPEAVDDISPKTLVEYRLYYSSSSNIGTVEDVTNNGTALMGWTRNIYDWPAMGLSPTNTYFFNVLVRDAAGNTSLHRTASVTTIQPPGDERVVSIGGIPVRFRYCPGGAFPFSPYGGSPDGEVRTVSGFWIGETEVTYALWYAVRSWALTNGYTFGFPGREGRDGVDGAVPTAASNQPACGASWCDVVIWCNAASELAGLSPLLLSNQAPYQVLRFSTNNSYASSRYVRDPFLTNGNGFCLPSVEQWACAGRYIDGYNWTPDNHASGASVTVNSYLTTNYAWCDENSDTTQTVGQLLPNAVGCFDMCGNAMEWCFDLGTSGTYYSMYCGRGYGSDYDTQNVGFKSQTQNYSSQAGLGFRLVLQSE